MTELHGYTALVTGASSGLGRDISRELARRGADLVLVARRADRLTEVKLGIESACHISAETISLDLSRPTAPEELCAELDRLGKEIDILVNNAGFGAYGRFLETELRVQEKMLSIDVLAPVRLTYLLGRRMVERGTGWIMQVASIGSFQPSPTFAAYSAAKSFILSWSEALDFELRGSGVSCTAVCPGVTDTEFHEHTGQKRTWYQRMVMMRSSTVAAIAVRAMLRRRMTIVPGFRNAVTVWVVRLFPRRFVRWAAYQTMRNE